MAELENSEIGALAYLFRRNWQLATSSKHPGIPFHFITHELDGEEY